MGVIKRSKFQPISIEADPLVELLTNNEASSPEPPIIAVSTLPAILPQGRPLSTRLQQNQKSDHGKPPVKEEKFPKGQKKRRRYENNKYLLNLANLEDRCDPGFTDNCSAFSKLLQEKDKMAAWNSFLAFDDDDQFAILANNEVYAYFNNESVLDETTAAIRLKIGEIREARRKLSADEAFKTLQPKIKSIFTKRHFPMGILIQLESEIVDFFTKSPKGTCVIERSCSFDRLIVHAICHFNILLSQSYTTEENRRQTHIRNWDPKFTAPAVSLSDYIQSKRT